MSRRREYNWESLQTRFVTGEWLDMGDMARKLKTAQAAGGPKAPSHDLINKRAAAENWQQKRDLLAEEKRAEASRLSIQADAQYLVRLAEEGRDLGRGLKAIGARFIQQREDKAAKAREADPTAQVDGAATTVYEAVALIRTGHIIESVSAKQVEDAKNNLAARQGKVIDAGSTPGSSATDPASPEFKAPEEVYSRLARLLGLEDEAAGVERPKQQ